MVASRYDADPSAADWRRFGRPPRFTNCKPKYREPDGLFPFVRLLRDCHLRQVTDLRKKISRKDALKSLEVLKAAGSSAIEMSDAKAPAPPAVS